MRMSTRHTLTAGVFLAVLSALVLFFENLVAVSLDESDYLSCSLDHSEVALDVATAGACLAAATAFGFGLARRPRPAFVAVGMQALFSVIWVLLGGLDAAGCPNRT
jgi:hypothetical protein